MAKTDRIGCGEIERLTIITGDFNSPLSVTDRSRRQKIIKERFDLTKTINQLDLIGIYRVFYPTITVDTFFSTHLEHSPK